MSRQYDYWVHQQLEPTDKLITGNAKRYQPTFIQKWKWIDELTPEQRERLKMEAEQEANRSKQDY